MVPCSGLPAAARSAGVSSPWSAELRTMWVSGSLIRSSTWRSSSVSAPCISSSICLPSSPDRSRTMRGSFCQALPIGCIRVFMTPSCSSAVTLDSRCSGTLNSVSSLRREISSSWLRVRTSSDTMVIRCSSVSTLTRIDWLATLSASWTSSAAAAALLGAGFAAAAGFVSFGAAACGAAAGAGCGARRGGCAGAASVAVSRKARSSSSSDTSPGRSGRSSVCGTRVPCGNRRAAQRPALPRPAKPVLTSLSSHAPPLLPVRRSGPDRSRPARPRSPRADPGCP